MRTSDVDILIVPGWLNSGADHWQSRWQRNLKTARRIEQEDWTAPDKDAWVASIIAAVATTARPAVLVAHSLGAIAVAYAAHKLPKSSVAGAFLVAPADVDDAQSWAPNDGHAWPSSGFGFAHVPLAPMPFPSILLASSNDPYCSTARAKRFAAAWASEFVDVGPAGHIAEASGRGPWPDGVLRFGRFLAGLKA